MNLIETIYFRKQVDKLKKKFNKIDLDINNIKDSLRVYPFSDLWNGVYKYRLKNSSIPTWKRSWFRLIILFLDSNNCIPLLIYSKNQFKNVTSEDILKAKKIILNELEIK